MRNAVVFSVLSVILICGIAHGLGADSIQWKTPGAARQTAASDAASALTSGVDRHVVVQFNAAVRPAARKSLASEGIELLSYLGSNAYFAKVRTGAESAKAAVTAGAAAVFDIEVDWKLHPMVAQQRIPEYALFSVPESVLNPDAPAAAEKSSAAQVQVAAVYVLFHSDVALDSDGVAVLQRHGGQVRALLKTINGMVAWLPYDNLLAFAAEDAVQWVEPPLPVMGPNNNSNRVITQADQVNDVPYNLDGTGVSVLVYDAGTARATHVDFGGRLAVHDDSGMIDHSTHVAGTIGGSGEASGGLYRGMAPGVLMHSYGLESDGTGQWLYSNPGDIEHDYNEAVNTYGAMIASNSIGTNVAWNGFPCDWEGDYGATDILIDEIVRGKLGEPFRIVWAAGNERGGACGSEYHLTAPPANAKNHILVGALNSNDDSMTSFSSWGPSDDGRLKPDIAGPGCQSNDDGGVTSCTDTGDTAYTTMCGTSMATPTVAGLSSLILEAWQAKYPGEALPRNSTLKILFAHSAADLGNTGPDFRFGYGSVRVKDSVDLMQNGTHAEADVSQGEDKLFFINVPEGTASLKATVAWDDFPGTANTVPELVNDLDLIAVEPGSGTVYYPWTLDPANPSASAVRTVADHLNNIEQVVVDNPAPGKWTIKVSGTVVPEGPQIFSIVTTPDFSTATKAGVILLNAQRYACDDTARVTVSDTDLNTDPNTAESVTVTVTSSAEPAGESVVLTETGADTSMFKGTVTLSATNAAGVLQVAEGDTITANYLDADDGNGGVNIARTASAAVDCTPPVISNLTVAELTGRHAVITFDTDEGAAAVVHCGAACEVLDRTATETGLRTSHSLTVRGLTALTTYYFEVVATDFTGNAATDNNGGACHSFTTLEQADYFTEDFSFGYDLANTSLVYLPDGSASYYTQCDEPADGFPSDPVDGTYLSLVDDDAAVVYLSGGALINFYGVQYDRLYVGSNGYVTFGTADGTYSHNISNHFALPRISGFFKDLNPTVGGTVSWKQFDDHVAVTWDGVPSYAGDGQIWVQVRIFFEEGRIDITSLGTTLSDGLVGISAGEGTPDDYSSSDLSEYDPCVWDDLVLRPGGGLSDMTCAGEAYAGSCKTYTLRNTGELSVDWAASWSEGWITVTPASGQIAGGDSVSVDVCIDGTTASALSVGTYEDNVSFVNLGTLYEQKRKVHFIMETKAGAPEAETPADTATEVAPYTELQWSSTPSASCATTYSVYLGTDPGAMALLFEHIDAASCYPGLLDPETTYYWQVIAENCCGDTPGPVWSFTTSVCAPPVAAGTPSPADGLTDVSIAAPLAWATEASSDLHCPLLFDVYFGTDAGSLSLLAQDLADAWADPGYLQGLTTYYWQVVSKNCCGETPGPVWSFTTQECYVPSVPADPAPADAAQGIWPDTTLSWSGGAPGDCPSAYDVYLGTDPAQMSLLCEGLSGEACAPYALGSDTTYYWQVVARNCCGDTPGPVWSFHTIVCDAPARPNSPFPADGAEHLSHDLTLSWASAAGSDCPVRFDLYLGTSPSYMALIANALSDPSYPLSGLTPGQRMYWQVVAYKCCGTVNGPVWSFTPESSDPTCLSSTAPSGVDALVCFDFESDLGGFTLDNSRGAGGGLWHRTDGCLGTSQHLYFGQDSTCTYATGAAVEGVAVSPVISLGQLTHPVLTFDYFCQTEFVELRDLATVSISSDGGSTYTPLAVNQFEQGVPALCDDGGASATTPQWRTAVLPLLDYLGLDIQLRFGFQTTDGTANDFAGFGVDNVCIYNMAMGPLPTYPIDFCTTLDQLVTAATPLLPYIPGDYQQVIEGMVCAESDINGGLDWYGYPTANGMLDAYELGVIGRVLNDLSFEGANGLSGLAVRAAFENNYGLLLTAVQNSTYGPLLPYMAPGLDTTLCAVLAGFIVEGDDVTFDSVMMFVNLISDIGGIPPAVSDLMRMPEYFAPDSDPDGDAYTNRQEYECYSSQSISFYANAVLDSSIFPEVCGEGEGEGEGQGEGEGEGETHAFHTADQNSDGLVDLSELLRVIQFFNSAGYHCQAGTEDGYAPGQGDQTCTPHDSDYNPQDWYVDLSELLRVIQFFNSAGYHACPGEGTEDGFCPGPV